MKSLLRNHILTGKVCCSEDGSHYCSAECERKRITLFPSVVIHRMQIWRTTRSPPGTSCMKARLVRPLCFAFAMLPQKSLASSSIWSVSFRPGCEFCVSECHQKGVKSSTEEKVFSFSLPVHL